MTTDQTSKTKASSHRVRGLDSIRFLCALWVAFSHGAYPPLTLGHDPNSLVAWFINGCYTTLFCGPAAVIIFFVISGFCIHYPYREKWSKAYVIPFLLSRAIRIIGPIGVIMIINIATDRPNISFYNLIGWSIVCELFYYFIYPFIRGLINTQQGWRMLFFISLTPTFLAPFLFELTTVNYPGLGPLYTPFLGLPCWLCGVLIAGQVDFEKQVDSKKLVILRLTVLIAGFVTHFLALQEIIGHPFTLNFFSILVMYWLREEILHFRDSPPWILLEKAGLASYSLYLVHGHVASLTQYTGLPNLGTGFNIIIHWIFLAGCTFCYFFLVEKPFHKLAKWTKHWSSGKRIG
jgi:peptidoglycan/LPS O-acetylase OafA/YrhL